MMHPLGPVPDPATAPKYGVSGDAAAIPGGPCKLRGGDAAGELCDCHAEAARWKELVLELRSHHQGHRPDALPYSTLADLIDEHVGADTFSPEGVIACLAELRELVACTQRDDSPAGEPVLRGFADAGGGTPDCR